MKLGWILIVLISFLPSAFATQSMLDAMVFVYPQIKDTPLNKCTTCHTGTRGNLLNDYGKDLLQAKLNFKQIENLDSDKDGNSNIEEIEQISNPGQKYTPSEYFTLNANGNEGPITFDHRSHQYEQAYVSNGNCKTCHRNDEFSRYITDVNSPSHTTLGKHKTCYGCHIQAVRDGNASAPMKCSGCHESQN